MYDINEDQGMFDLILVDGSMILHRAAHSYADLGFLEGAEYVHTGVIFGSLKMISSVWEQYGSRNGHLIVCWDGGYKHRLEIYPEYKANRRSSKTSEADRNRKHVMRSQVRALRRIMKVAGWTQAQAEGYEADDVMATLAKRGREKGQRVAIYTADQDLHQCVHERVQVVAFKPRASQGAEIWGIPEVVDRWGFPPERVAELKALAGDGGDNIPGCPGCGKSWAKKLLKSYGSVPAILDASEKEILNGEWEGKKWRAKSLTAKMRAARDDVLISWELAKVVEDVPVDITWGTLDEEVLQAFLHCLRFNSLLSEMNYSKLIRVARLRR